MKYGILKSTTLAGLFGLGLLAATPALAHRVYVNCDRDGDRCVRTVCDNDGDRCTRVVYRDRDRSYYRERYSYRQRYDRRRDCDRRGDDCHWRNDRW